MQTTDQSVAEAWCPGSGRPWGEMLSLHVVVSEETIHIAGDPMLTGIYSFHDQVEKVSDHPAIGRHRVV